tara:strand:- start:978 stop:1319 length:342 start_codon:yes stop_codon:yes gene_type:complete
MLALTKSKIMKATLLIISLLFFGCGSEESNQELVSESDWPLEEINKMLEECSSDSTEEFNIDVPCSCLVNAVSINVNYDDYKAMENNQEGVFLPVEIEMQEEVLEAMINCGVE